MNKRTYLEILLIAAYLTRGVFSQADSCSVDSAAGPDNPKNFNKDFDKDKGFGYVVYEDLYRIKCCGTVKKWEFSVGDNGNIELQVWRPDDKKNKKFKLVGLNKYSVSKKVKAKPGYVTYNVDNKDLLNVQENDVIGWFAPGDSLVEYTDGTDYNGIWKLKHDDKVKVGDTVDFSAGDKQSSRTYGIQATVAPNSPPEFDLLLATSISMNAEIGTTVYTVQVNDADTPDAKGLKMEMLTKNDFFAFNPKTGVLSVSSEITVSEGGESVTFDFKVTDSCGAEGTGSLTVHIDHESSRPTFPPRTDPNTDTEPTTTLEATKKTTTLEETTTKATQTTKDAAKTTKDGKTTKAKTTSKTSVATVPTTATTVTESITVKDKTTIPSVSVTDKDTANETMTAMDKGPSIDAALIGGIVAGVVGLFIIIVVTVVCVVNKKAKVTPSSKDPEKANNTTKESNAKNNSNEMQSSPDKKAPDNKPSMNGKPHVKDK